MPTVGTVEFKLISGVVGNMAAFNAAIQADIDAGYSILGDQPQTDGVGVWQFMFKGVAASFIAQYSITGVSSGAAPGRTFTIGGNQVIDFNPGYKFTLIASTGNDGIYTVVSSTYGANTVITVKESVASAVADGFIIAYAPSVGP